MQQDIEVGNEVAERVPESAGAPGGLESLTASARNARRASDSGMVMLQKQRPARDPLVTQLNAIKQEETTALVNRVYDGLTEQSKQRAREIAQQTTLDKTDVLLEISAEARQHVREISQLMIGETRLGDIEALNQLFTSFQNIHDTLNAESLIEQPGMMEAIMRKLPLIGGRYDRLREFLRRYNKVAKEILENEGQVADMRVGVIETRTQFEVCRERLLEYFGVLAISIAAGELVLDREREKFNKLAKSLEGVTEIPRLEAALEEREKLMALNSRLCNLQGKRVSLIATLSVVKSAISNAKQLEQTLQDIEETTIAEIENQVAIYVGQHKLRQSAKAGTRLQDQALAMQEASVRASGMLQEESMKATLHTANQADFYVNILKAQAQNVRRGAELMNEADKLIDNARKKFLDIESEFIDEVQTSLKESIKGVPKSKP